MRGIVNWRRDDRRSMRWWDDWRARADVDKT